MSLEGVFAAIAAWIILNQILGYKQCYRMYFNFICGVLFSQLLPIV